MLQDAYIQAERAKTFLLDVPTDTVSLIVYTVGAVLILMTLGYTLHKAKKIPGEEHMNKGEYVLSRRQRRLRQNEMVADGIGDLLLHLYAKCELTEEDYQRWILRCGSRLGLRDLMPRKLDPNSPELKAAIRRRAGKLHSNFPKEAPPVKKLNALELALSKTVV